MGVIVLLHRIVADPKMVQFDTAPPGLTLLTALTVRRLLSHSDADNSCSSAVPAGSTCAVCVASFLML